MSNPVPTFSLAYTTARPHAVAQIINLWNSRSKNKDHEWVVSVDDGTPEEVLKSLEGIATKLEGCKGYSLVINKGPKNCVAGWNAAAENTTGKVIIAVSDDFVPPQDWDQVLLDLKPEGWIDGEHVVHVNDGFIGHLFTLAILTRKRMERFGYMWYPGYESMFVDTEFGDRAHQDGVVIEAMHLLFEHCHHCNGKRPKDTADANHENQVRWKRGEMLYNYRKSVGFPIDVGPKAGSEGPPKTADRKYCAYLQITKDDFCLAEVCKRMIEEGVTDFFFSVPSEYWDGKPLKPSDLQEIAEATKEIQDAGGKVNTKIFKVAFYRFPGDTRIDTETRLRNDALAWIRAAGFVHILIVDGDELWLPGTLPLIDSIVAQGVPAISCRMVPVCGLPGCPVDQAQDLAVVYIGGACQFKACRTPVVKQSIIQSPRIIHFTGTRRTMEEIIEKHRVSGHYDDKEYDFEGWLEHILPNIKPGFTRTWPNGTVGVHMYQPYNPWPRFRDWRPEEYAAIPEKLRSYLVPMATT